MVNRPKIAGTSAESMVVQYCKENGWPYAKRLSLNGAVDLGDVDLHPRLAIEVKSTTGALKIGPWMNETDKEQVNARADYGILVIKYPGVGAKNVGKFLTCMRFREAQNLHRSAGPIPGGWHAASYGIKQEPVKNLKELGDPMPMVIHQARGRTPDNDYQFMWLEDRLELLKLAGYGETRHVERSTDE